LGLDVGLGPKAPQTHTAKPAPPETARYQAKTRAENKKANRLVGFLRT